MIVVRSYSTEGVQTYAVAVPHGQTTRLELPTAVVVLEITNDEAPLPDLSGLLKEAQGTLEAIRRAGGWVDRSDEWGDE